jgi:hypothetical protein
MINCHKVSYLILLVRGEKVHSEVSSYTAPFPSNFNQESRRKRRSSSLNSVFTFNALLPLSSLITVTDGGGGWCFAFRCVVRFLKAVVGAAKPPLSSTLPLLWCEGNLGLKVHSVPSFSSYTLSLIINYLNNKSTIVSYLILDFIGFSQERKDMFAQPPFVYILGPAHVSFVQSILHFDIAFQWHPYLHYHNCHCLRLYVVCFYLVR